VLESVDAVFAWAMGKAWLILAIVVRDPMMLKSPRIQQIFKTPEAY
jgi:hypothetical protein